MKLRPQNTPAVAPAATSETEGRFKDVARSYVMAAMFGARMTQLPMLFGVQALARRFDHWGTDEDRRLLHLLGYWKQHAGDRLVLTVGYSDPIGAHLYTDTDHASDIFTRKSTTGAALMFEGPITKVSVHSGAKMQPTVARSSGEAESVGVDEAVRNLLGIHDDAAGLVHGTSRAVAAMGVPCIDLAERMGLSFDTKTIRVDASVALTAITKGFSRVMAYLPKTQGVNLAFLSEVIENLGFKIEKVHTSANVADVFTKAVTKSVLAELLPRLGIVQVQ